MTDTGNTSDVPVRSEPMIATVEVRNAKRDDLPGILVVERGAKEPWDVYDHREFMTGRQNCTAVAAVGHRIYGLICVTVNRREVMVERLVVMPEVRRSGIGTFLIGCAERSFCLKGEKVIPVRTVVSEYDLVSQLFLRACGWKWEKTILPIDGEGDFFVMAKTPKKDEVL